MEYIEKSRSGNRIYETEPNAEFPRRVEVCKADPTLGARGYAFRPVGGGKWCPNGNGGFRRLRDLLRSLDNEAAGRPTLYGLEDMPDLYYAD
jgi:hypothetical protein